MYRISHRQFRLPIRRVYALLAVAGAVTQVCPGQGLQYYDADLSFINGTDNIAAADSNLGLFDTFNPSFSDPAADGVWDIRGATNETTMMSDNSGARPAGSDMTAEQSVFASGGRGAENSPELVQSISGLPASTSYDVYAVYWSATNADWTVRAGFTSNPGANALFNRTGADVGGQPAIAGAVAASALWTTPPGPNSDAGLFTEGNREMLLGKVGTASSTGSGQLQVFIDDASTEELSLTSTFRTWYDGLAIVAAGTPVVAEATLDRDSGVLSFFAPFPVASYSVASASGSLDATLWNSIATGSNSSLDSDPWQIVEGVDTNLEEAETPAVDGVSLSSNISLGSVWRSSPFEDLALTLTLADASEITVPITYSGTAFELGDLDTDRDIDIDDYQILVSNLHKPIDTLVDDTDLEQYLLGDLTGDSTVDYKDIREFQLLYATANPAGTLFATATVPEPASLAVLLVGTCALAWRRLVRRASSLGAALVVVALVVGSCPAADAQLTSLFDIDGEGGTVGPTQTDWTSVLGTTTATDANNVSLTLTGNIAGRGRDRGTAATVLGGDNNDNQVPEGDFAAMYQDFVFLGVGEELTVDITGLTPNASYSLTAWSYDSGAFNGNAQDIAVNQDFLVGGNVVANLSYEGDLAGGIGPDPDTSALNDYAATFAIVADGGGNASFSTVSAGTQGARLNGVRIGAPPELLSLEVDRGTGAVSILNDNPSAISFDYYEIASQSGSLSFAGWNSLDDQDTEPDPFNNGWDEAGGSSDSILSEVRGIGEGNTTVAASGGMLSLGSAFKPGATEDLVFRYGLDGGSLTLGSINYVGDPPAGLLGDFNGDDVVNIADYTVWRDNLGANDSVLAAGSTNDGSGIVDAADYALWKASFGNTAAAAVAASQAVPEPGTCLLTLVGMLGLANRRIRGGTRKL